MKRVLAQVHSIEKKQIKITFKDEKFSADFLLHYTSAAALVEMIASSVYEILSDEELEDQ